MRLKMIALSLLAALVAAPALPADRDLATLTITVLDEAKERPVAKASVTVSFVSGRKMKVLKKIQKEWNSKTNNRGIVEFDDVPEGQVKLQVIAPGFRTYGDQLEVTAPQQNVTIKLKKPSGKQYSAHEIPQ